MSPYAGNSVGTLLGNRDSQERVRGKYFGVHLLYGGCVGVSSGKRRQKVGLNSGHFPGVEWEPRQNVGDSSCNVVPLSGKVGVE